MTGEDEQHAVAAVERLARSCVGVLDAPPASAILHGSLTLGDFRPGRSDLDLLLVVGGALTAREDDALVAVVRDADPSPADGIDLTVLTRACAAAPAERPCLELHVGRFGRESDLEVDRREVHVPDLWPELSMARAHGRALDGADPREIIGDVPPELVRDRGVHWLTVWLDLTDDQKNASLMVLTACRIWRFAAEDTHCAKSSAARWALEQDASLVAVDQALAQRTGAPETTFDPDDVRGVLETVLERVRAL